MIKILYWLPRLLAILFIGFLSLFALDVFDGSSGLWPTLGALLMHLIPSFILIIIIIIAWKRPKVGGLIFLLIGLLFTFAFHTYNNWLLFTAISLPVFLVGGLFLLNKK